MHAWATDHSPSASNRATMQIFLDLFRSGECWPVHPGFQPLVCCSPAGGDWHGQRLSGCHCELEEPLHHGETRCVRPAFSVLKIYKNLPGGRLRCTGAVVSGAGLRLRLLPHWARHCPSAPSSRSAEPSLGRDGARASRAVRVHVASRACRQSMGRRWACGPRVEPARGHR